MSKIRLAAALCTLAPLWTAGCHTNPPYANHQSDAGTVLPTNDGGKPPLSDMADMAGTPDAAPPDPLACTTTFHFVPTKGQSPHAVQVSGEWNNWASPGVALAADGSGGFQVEVALTPGLIAYKLIVDGTWQLDPAGQGLRKYVGGVENSAVRVSDCHLPSLSLKDKKIDRASPGQGHFTANVLYQDGKGGPGIDPATVKAVLRNEDMRAPLQGISFDAATMLIKLDAPALTDGKYLIYVDAADKAGKPAKTLRLPFWIEAEAFDWHDALIYMAMTDRFVNGDKTNDAPATQGVDPRADFHGGDLQGVRQKIASGTFDKLGVRALWLSPFHRNPAGSYVADDGVHQVTGYHGYWPVKPREVDPRIGGDGALTALVKEAHAHGIRILGDFVVNHVHQEHDYFKQHPEWFRTGCVCGTNNCDWTVHRLDCLFAPYLPDVNWTVPAVAEQYGDDAVWWLDTFDIDGLRVDAVKHVEDVAVTNLTARIRGEFEAAGTRVFLTGETAMGWSDCGLQCNADQYGTIARYIGPYGLDGQADFVLYHAIPYRVFSNDQKGMLHVDYWTQQSQLQYPEGAIMTPYIGSHDTARLSSFATYRGQDQAHDPAITGNKWVNIVTLPPDAEAYARLRLGLSWLFALPGAPMIYYGDEYGEWGGSDPNNRVNWRGDSQLSGDEQQTLAYTRALGTARKQLPALRRGTYISVHATEDVLLFARVSGNEAALVALSRSPSQQSFTTMLPNTVPIAEGTTLHDRLGGPDVVVNQKMVTVTLQPRGAAILAQ